MGRLGITKSIWNQYKELSDYYTNAKSVKGAVTFHAVGTQGAYAGMDIIITFQIKTGYYGFGSENSAYGGFGTVDYTIKMDEKGKGVPKPKKPIGSGMVTYANYDKFAGHLQKVAEKQIKMLYNIPGKEVDKICDAFCGGTFYKVANQTFGSGSDAVYATVKNMVTDNDEAIKNDIKDFTINLARSGLQKTTKHSIHCPVDVYVDDCEGNQIASIVDNVVTNSSEEIVLYVVGDDKYVVLPSDELYSIRFEGNDTGTMNYEVTEYINSEEQYQYEYKDIPLSNTLHYSNISFDSMGNGKLYDLLKEEEYIEPDAVTVNEDSEYYSAVIPAESIRIRDGQSEEEQTAIPLAPEEERKLYADIEPYNASYTNVTWESSDDTIVSVDEIGQVTALQGGSATVTATLQNGANGEVLSDEIEVTVSNDTKPSSAPLETFSPVANPSQKPASPLEPTTKPSAPPSAYPGGQPSGISGNPSGGNTAVAPGTQTQYVKPSAAKKPGKVTGLNLRREKRSVFISWTWQMGVSGWQIQYARNKKFTKQKKTKTAGKYANEKTIRGLKSKKTYYIRVRAYKKSNGKKQYGKWSKAKKVKIR